MNKKTIKIAMLSMLPLVMIATVYYYSALQATFYKGRTQYLAGADPVIVTTDSNGQPWVLDSFNSGGTLRTLQADKWITSNLYRGWASSMVFDQEGNIWIADSQYGVYKSDGKKRISFKPGNSGLASERVNHLAFDHAGRIWMAYSLAFIGSAAPEPKFGVTVFDGKTWTTFNTNNSELISNEVTAIAFDPENRAWLGTPGGISIFDGKKWIAYSPSNSGLVANAISSIAFDRQGRAWIGSMGDQNGINMFDGKEWVYYSLEEIGFRDTYSEFGSDILIDPSDRIWIQNDGEVRIFDGKSWIGLAEEDGYGNSVSSITVDKQGKIWVANRNGRGLVLLDADYPLASAWSTQPQRTFLASGGIWYMAFILVCLFTAILLNSFMTVALTLLVGISITIGWMVIFNDLHVFYFFPLPIGNPGVYATVGAMIGAFAGIMIAIRSETLNRSRFAVIGLVLGLAIGICQILPGMLAQ